VHIVLNIAGEDDGTDSFGGEDRAFFGRPGHHADFARTPGSRLINQADVPMGMSPNYFVSTRRSVKANLFRIYLEQ
jgi:hypothetical protein